MYRGSSSFLPIVVPFRERSFFHSLHDASCKPPQTHTLTRTLAYVFSCSLRWISVCPSVIHFAPKSAKRFPTGGMARSSLAHDCSHGVCSSLFRPDFHQASTPLLRFRSGALNMRAYSFTARRVCAQGHRLFAHTADRAAFRACPHFFAGVGHVNKSKNAPDPTAKQGRQK